MPGTASTRNTDRGSSRPSAVARAINKNTPVLFRLPLVETKHGDAEVNLDGSDLSHGEQLAVDVEHVAAATVQTASNTAAVTPPVIASSLTEPEQAAPTLPPPQASITAESKSGHGWWEHWSSGIVLILLIVALVAASVIALNDSGSSIDQLADVDSPSDGDFDLTNLQIPDIQVSMPPAIVESSQPNQSQATPDSLALELPEAQPVVVEPASQSKNLPRQNLQPETVQLENPSQGAALQLTPNSNSLIVSEVEFPTPQATSNGPLPLDAPAAVSNSPVAENLPPQTIAAQPTNPQPLATLSTPVGTPAPPLFAEPAGRPSNNGDPDVPSLTVASPAGLEGSTQGGSPTLYDGAGTNIGQPSTSDDGTYRTASGPVDTNMPPLSATLAGLNSGSGIFTATRKPEANAPTASERTGSAVASATPEMDADAIVQAYLQFKALNKAQNMPSNRYQLSPPAPNQSAAAGQLPLQPPASGIQ
jgi:hypothetical protein